MSNYGNVEVHVLRDSRLVSYDLTRELYDKIGVLDVATDWNAAQVKYLDDDHRLYQIERQP